MKKTEVIKASEARQFVIDLNREAKGLCDEAVSQILEDLDTRVRNMMKYGNLEAHLSLNPIFRLNSINMQAAHTAVTVLSHYLNDLGYRFDSFSNNSAMVTVRWDK